MTKIQDVAQPITAEQLIAARERAKNGVIWKIRQEVERLKGVAKYYPYHGDYLLALSELSDFLDTLPEQPAWKPSEEQMFVLRQIVAYNEDTINEIGAGYAAVLESLYEQLKKL